MKECHSRPRRTAARHERCLHEPLRELAVSLQRLLQLFLELQKNVRSTYWSSQGRQLDPGMLHERWA